MNRRTLIGRTLGGLAAMAGMGGARKASAAPTITPADIPRTIESVEEHPAPARIVRWAIADRVPGRARGDIVMYEIGPDGRLTLEPGRYVLSAFLHDRDATGLRQTVLEVDGDGVGRYLWGDSV